MNGRELQRARQQRGLTQAALAARAGISRSSVAAVERGDRTGGAAKMRASLAVAPLIERGGDSYAGVRYITAEELNG